MQNTSAEIAAQDNFPVRIRTDIGAATYGGRVGTAIEYNGQEIRIAFDGESPRWFHRSYVDLVGPEVDH